MFVAEKMMKIILTVLLYFIYLDGVKGTATITSLGCESANGLSSHLTVGREYTMYCTITSPTDRPVIVWMIEPNYSITVTKNTVASAGNFTARPVKSDRKLIFTASLTFTATTSLDQKVIACMDSPIGVSLIRDECRLQIGNSGSNLNPTRVRSTTSTRASPTHTVPVISIGARSTSTVSTTSTRAGATSNVPVTLTRAGATSNVPVTLTRAGPRPTLATTTLPTCTCIVWSTGSSTPQTTLLTPVPTNTASPTSATGKRIVNIIIIPVIAVTVVIAIVTGICLLSIFICKKRPFRKYSNSQDHSNPASHVESTNECNSVPPPPVYDYITIEPKVTTQSPDLHYEVAQSTTIMTLNNTVYGIN